MTAHSLAEKYFNIHKRKLEVLLEEHGKSNDGEWWMELEDIKKLSCCCFAHGYRSPETMMLIKHDEGSKSASLRTLSAQETQQHLLQILELTYPHYLTVTQVNKIFQKICRSQHSDVEKDFVQELLDILVTQQSIVSIVKNQRPKYQFKRQKTNDAEQEYYWDEEEYHDMLIHHDADLAVNEVHKSNDDSNDEIIIQIDDKQVCNKNCTKSQKTSIPTSK